MRWRIAGAGVAFALAALCAASSPARGAELLIASPSACAMADDLSFRAESALGQSLESAADVRCTVHITREGAAYAARLDVEAIPAPARARSFSAPSCDMLMETLALAVALAIASGTPDPEPGGQRATRELPASAQLPAAHPVAAVDSGSELGSAPADSSGGGQPRFGASAALVADVGTLPGVGVGASLGASIGIDSVALSLLGTYLPPRSATMGTARSTSPAPVAELELVAGSLLAGVPRLLQTSELAFGAFAGVEAGRLTGRGTGLDVTRSGGSWWTAARADAEAHWILAGSLSLDVRLSALVPWQRDEFAVAGIGRVFRAGAVVGRATVGLSYEFDALFAP